MLNLWIFLIRSEIVSGLYYYSQCSAKSRIIFFIYILSIFICSGSSEPASVASIMRIIDSYRMNLLNFFMYSFPIRFIFRRDFRSAP